MTSTPNGTSPEAPLRFQVSRPSLIGREREYVLNAVESGWISGSGPYIRRLEDDLEAFLGLQNGVAVASGTAALHLALLVAGCRPGDEVIVPSMTYVACANAIRYCGATPVFVDCDPTTWNVTTDIVRAAFTSKTRGVLLVHLFGRPAPADEIELLCLEHGAWLVEDCAQSLGSKLAGKSTGSFGFASCFSFYGNKVISCGEGGIVFARSSQQLELLRSLRCHGVVPEREHWHQVIGYNYRLSNVAAAIGCAQLEDVDVHIRERIRVCDRYRRNLNPLSNRGLIRLPSNQGNVECVPWHATLVLEHGKDAYHRDHIREVARKDHGIQTRPFFVPLHEQPIYRREISLPTTEFLSQHGIMLPTYAELRDEEIDEICTVLIDLIEREFDATHGI